MPKYKILYKINQVKTQPSAGKIHRALNYQSAFVQNVLENHAGITVIIPKKLRNLTRIVTVLCEMRAKEPPNWISHGLSCPKTRNNRGVVPLRIPRVASSGQRISG
jgi:hypothetical protein